jgi:hypothetical protein
LDRFQYFRNGLFFAERTDHPEPTQGQVVQFDGHGAYVGIVTEIVHTEDAVGPFVRVHLRELRGAGTVDRQ